MFESKGLAIFFTLLFSAIYMNLLWLLAVPIWLGIFIGATLAWLPERFAHRTTYSEQWWWHVIGIITLLLITAVILFTTLPALLNQHDVSLDKVLPLFIATLILYVYCVYLDNQKWNDSVHARLTAGKELAVTTFPLLLTFCTAVILMSSVLWFTWFLRTEYPSTDYIAIKLLDRGIIPPLTILLFIWALLLLVNHWLRLRDMRRSFMTLLRAVEREKDWHYYRQKSEESYMLPYYIAWAIPILGFVGTVLGISLAASGIEKIIGTQQGLGSLSSNLGEAIAPLGIAFDTTLVALSLSLILTLIQTLLQRWEAAIFNEP